MARIALIRTRPESVLEDIGEAMRLAGYAEHLDRTAPTALKTNITWQRWYPACSTTPWQLDGTIRTLLGDGYERESLFAAQNRTVVVDARAGERANRLLPVIDAHRVRNSHLYEDAEWVLYKPRGRMRTLPDVFPRGIRIPKQLIGANVIHLPTMKTHVFTTITGAMKNAFGVCSSTSVTTAMPRFTRRWWICLGFSRRFTEGFFQSWTARSRARARVRAACECRSGGCCWPARTPWPWTPPSRA